MAGYEGVMRQLAPRLKQFRNKHRGQRCFVLGNGPSLARTDVARLHGELVFGCNMIFIHPVLHGLVKYYFEFDKRHLQLLGNRINAYSVPQAKFHSWHKRMYVRGPKVVLYKGIAFKNNFSRDVRKGVVFGETVVYDMLQFAYFMGCNPVYLVGIDADCSGHWVPPIEYYCGCEELVRQENPAYLKVAKQKLNSILPRAWLAARRAFDADGREIVNATVGGKLEAFRRAKFHKILRAK